MHVSVQMPGMEKTMIESITNSQVKRILKLKKNAKYRREEGVFVVEGWKMTAEALERGIVETLYISERFLEDWKDNLNKAWRETEDTPKEKMREIEDATRVEFITSRLFLELSGTVTPQGVLAVVKMPVYDRKSILAFENSAVVCLEDIQDPGNLGTIMRTAEGAGMSGLVLSKGCVDLFNPKVVRATMGSIFRVPYYICDDIVSEAERLRAAGFTTYAADLEGTCDYTEESYEGRMAILIGNEANGLSANAAEQADRKVKIPMEGRLESLNAAVSSALFMYEIHRRR